MNHGHSLQRQKPLQLVSAIVIEIYRVLRKAGLLKASFFSRHKAKIENPLVFQPGNRFPQQRLRFRIAQMNNGKRQDDGIKLPVGKFSLPNILA